MRGRGRITAFERDKKRFQTLNFMLERAGATNVVAKNRDFTTVDPLDPEYANVTHMYVATDHSSLTVDAVSSLLDPSCSGSGIVNRMDYLLPQGMTAILFRRTRVDISVLENMDSDARDSEERLEKLSAFQLKMITHALKCKTAVTLTCTKLINL